MKNRKKNEILKNKEKCSIEDLREEFISLSRQVMIEYLKGATGKTKFKGSGIQREAVWELLRDMMIQAGDRAKLNVYGGDVEKQIKKVLRKVSRGKLSPKVAKEYIGLIQAGISVDPSGAGGDEVLAKLIINTTTRK